MLYVTEWKAFENPHDSHYSTVSVLIGQAFSGKPKNVVRVMADGEELHHIKATMTGLPMAGGNKVVEWFGDHAKFIAANWR